MNSNRDEIVERVSKRFALWHERYPDVFEGAVGIRAKGVNWPPVCFVPMEDWLPYIESKGQFPTQNREMGIEAAKTSCMFSWAFSRQVVCIQDTAGLSSPEAILAKHPSKICKNLLWRCVYVTGVTGIAGYYACLDYTQYLAAPLLVILIEKSPGSDLVVFKFPLGNPTFKQLCEVLGGEMERLKNAPSDKGNSLFEQELPGFAPDTFMSLMESVLCIMVQTSASARNRQSWQNDAMTEKAFAGGILGDGTVSVKYLSFKA